MFSLIITIISIALVAALVLATLYYGGAAFNKGSAKADAAKILLQGQQLMGASELYRADEGAWPKDMLTLLSSKYLTTVPQAQADGQSAINSATAASIGWSMPKNYSPMFLLDKVASAEVCRYVNLQGSLKREGILEKAYPGLAIQCYGPDKGTLKVLIKKGTDADSLAGPLVGVDPGEVATGSPPTDPADTGWNVPPGPVTGTAPGGGPGGDTPPPVLGTSTGLSASQLAITLPGAEVGQYGDPIYPVLTNTNAAGGAALTLTGFAMPSPENQNFWYSLSRGSSNCAQRVGLVLQPGESCNFELQFSPQSVGVLTGTLTVKYTSGSGTPTTVAIAVSATATAPYVPPIPDRTAFMLEMVASMVDDTFYLDFSSPTGADLDPLRSGIGDDFLTSTFFTGTASMPKVGVSGNYGMRLVWGYQPNFSGTSYRINSRAQAENCFSETYNNCPTVGLESWGDFVFNIAEPYGGGDVLLVTLPNQGTPVQKWCLNLSVAKGSVHQVVGQPIAGSCP